MWAMRKTLFFWTVTLFVIPTGVHPGVPVGVGTGSSVEAIQQAERVKPKLARPPIFKKSRRERSLEGSDMLSLVKIKMPSIELNVTKSLLLLQFQLRQGDFMLTDSKID
jgi:hypothetical protein